MKSHHTHISNALSTNKGGKWVENDADQSDLKNDAYHSTGGATDFKGVHQGATSSTWVNKDQQNHLSFNPTSPNQNTENKLDMATASLRNEQSDTHGGGLKFERQQESDSKHATGFEARTGSDFRMEPLNESDSKHRHESQNAGFRTTYSH